MDLVQKIKDHIIALNSISYDDDTQLELYSSQLKDTFFQIFGPHSQFVTYLNSIRFHPISPVVPVEESVRCWARGKKQLRDLLFVVLEDPVLKDYTRWHDRDLGQEAAVEVAAAEQIVADVELRATLPHTEEISSSLLDVIQAFKNKVKVDISLAGEAHSCLWEDEERQVDHIRMPRVRIDLRHLDLLHDGVETYFVHKASFLPKDRTKKVLFISSLNSRQDQKVRGFFSATEATLVDVSTQSGIKDHSLDQITQDPSIQMAVFMLSRDSGVSLPEAASLKAGWWPSPVSCFQLGYLLSKLGRRRVIALYEESLEFHRPAGYFDVIYIAMTASGAWRHDLAQYLKEGKIAVKDEAHPFFYAS
ncbi:MAG: hypothetical protein HQL21_04090 [Candidatus Omnitrophica bacterium]|nr:hypothetical protein [Candidatus Omnitrophota bacterium]